MLILSFLSISQAYLTQTCISYSCSGQVYNSTLSQCVSNTSTPSVSTCNNSLHCEIPSQSQPGYCIQTQNTSTYAYPGESCSNTTLCLYGNCTSGTCVGIQKETACIKTQQCDVGLSCRKNLCLAQIGIGQTGCYNDYDCVNNAGCNTTNENGSGMCIEYFSVAAQSKVDSCFGNKNLLCQSGTCSEYASGYVCLPLLSNSLSSPYACGTGDYCYSAKDSFTGVILTGKCRCSLNGKSYCSLFPGDTEVMDYYQYSRAWVKTQAIFGCHSIRRFDSDCINQKWDSKKNSYLYDEVFIRDYAYVQNASSCLDSMFCPDYTAAQTVYLTSFAGALVFSLLWFS